ncbi:hypothetical protein EV178_002912 [Coemansia sp. RSA 1646]|nr:hypothetical protein EV178_002912 [Coemansia sp. RSA 1646]
MGYFSILDAAPSSVSSTAVSLAGSLLSVLGTAFVILNLCILRRRQRRNKSEQHIPKRQWSPRHYLILALSCVNLISALSGLLSGGVYLVYGRIPSQAGCTASGMFTYWAQQADGISIVFIALVVYASQFHRAQWTQGKYWVQHNKAPVVGVIVLLPLVGTVIVQIIWQFRSEEHAYCWVPRVPVYARWVAIDSWRLILVGALCLMYVRIACAKKVRQRTQLRSPQTACRRCSVIDSTATDKGAGLMLWSQSVHNMHRWAMSKLGRSNLHETINGTSSSSMANQNGTKKTKKKQSRSYYEQFKKSLISLITRHFVITTDIPSPTLSHGIFDNICKSSKKPAAWEDEEDGDEYLSTSVTQCDVCSSTSANRCCNESIASRPIEVSDADDQRSASKAMDTMSLSSAAGMGLRRWYSAVSRILRPPAKTTHPAVVPGYTLRRSHTAPNLSAKQMNLCDSAFGRPTYPGRVANTGGRGSRWHRQQQQHQQWPVVDSIAFSGDMVRSNNHTLIASYAAARAVQPTHYACDSVVDDYEYSSVDATDDMSAADPIPVFSRCGAPGFQTAYPPQHLSIYTFREEAAAEEEQVASTPSHQQHHSAVDQRSLSMYSDPNAEMVLSSLEEGSWMATVEKCRSNRSYASNNGGKISRLYVYPLAYVALWLPSLVYCVMSTYVYHRAFESDDGFLNTHVKRGGVDLTDLPAHWTHPENMHRAWPYYLVATHGIAGSSRLSWLVIIQALHLLGGFVDAVLFWLTEYVMA